MFVHEHPATQGGGICVHATATAALPAALGLGRAALRVASTSLKK
jgi:hypothetical protein